MVVICRYRNGAHGKHGIQYLLYVVYRANVAWSQVHRHYRYRFGIETSYRIKNQARIRSTTKNPRPAATLRRPGLYPGQSLGLLAVASGECDPTRRATGLSRTISAQNHAFLHPPGG
jgi:hypothetical protein